MVPSHCLTRPVGMGVDHTPGHLMVDSNRGGHLKSHWVFGGISIRCQKTGQVTLNLLHQSEFASEEAG